MPEALEGSQALARAVALCRPGVVSAYPITPQTHIVENISRLVADGRFDCEFVSVESEFSAASVALGAAAAGSRAYTASSSQGILLMSEVLFDIAGLRIPLVMTCANRAVSGPLSIWNDHQDSMAVRDAGWIQIYCMDNQEAVDSTIQAYRIAERVELPVMVCVDGFTLTHTLEPVDLPDQESVDAFLPPYRFSRALDPMQPITVGTIVAPEYFTEMRSVHHQALLNAASEVESAARDWAAVCGRDSGALVSVHGPEDAQVAIVALGSVVGTLQEAMDLRPDLGPVRIIRLRCFRPFPVDAIQNLCAGLSDVIVLERALSPGAGGIVVSEVRAALSERSDMPRVHGFAVGLGGRDVPVEIYERALEVVQRDRPNRFSILDLNPELIPEEDR